MKQQSIDYINKKIEKYSKMVEKSEKIYKGNESKYTFHGGASYGYEKGKLGAYEDMKDELQDLGDGWIKPNGQDLVKGDVLAIDYQGNCQVGYLVPYKNDPGFYCQGEETVLDDVEYYQIIIPPNK